MNRPLASLNGVGRPGRWTAMPLGTDYARQDCSLARALELIGERWTLLILRDAFWGVHRFTDFQAPLDVSRAVLSARLEALVADGLLTRTGTGHSTYHLTEAGTPPRAPPPRAGP